MMYYDTNILLLRNYFYNHKSRCHGKSLTKCQPDQKPHLLGGTSDHRLAWPKVVSHLATRCLCQGYVWPKVSLTWSMTKCQPDQKPHLLGGTSDHRLAWPKVVSHLATRCLCQGYVWPKVSLTWGMTKCQHDPKPYSGGYIWTKVSLTQSLTKCQPDLKPHPGGTSDQRSTWQSHITLGHKMSLPGGTSDPRSTWPEVWWNVNLTWSLILRGTSDQRSTWPEDLTKMSTWQEDFSWGVHLTKCRKVIWKFEHTLHFRSCFTEVFSTKDQQNPV